MNSYNSKKPKNEKKLKFSVRKFATDNLRDVMLCDLIDFWKELNILKEMFKGMTPDLIPPEKKFRIDFLTTQTHYLSSLMVA